MNRRAFVVGIAVAAAGASAVLVRRSLSVEEKRSSMLIGGSSTMLALNQALAAEFSRFRPWVEIVVESGGSLAGLIALKRGAIDLAAMSRDLAVTEDDVRTRNYLVAKDAITIVVNKKSAIKGLARQQVRSLLSGDFTNWKQVGGPNAPVRVISRRTGSTTRQFVEDIVLGGGDIAGTAPEVPSAKQLTEQVASDPFAVGYLALKDSESSAEISRLQVDGVAVSRATILSDRYPYTHSLYLVAYGDPRDAAAEFVAFARSPAGQKIVDQQNLVPVY